MAAIWAPKSGYDAVLTQNFAAIRPGRARSGVFVHDLIFRDHPEWFSRKERLYLALIPTLSRRADNVFTSSASEADRINRYVPVAATAVGLALPINYDRIASKPPRINLNSQSFILSVGRLNVRKNISRFATALQNGNVINSSNPLVVVGEPDGEQELGATAARDNVLWTGYVADDELKWLYENCSVFAFPSLDEGYGLPVLEAANAGAAIAMSAIPAFLEFDVQAEYFDPRSDDSIRVAVRKALASTGRTSRLPTEWSDVVDNLRSRLRGE